MWPFQQWQDSDKASYLLRQHVYSNLHHRLSTRPFLSSVEKVSLVNMCAHVCLIVVHCCMAEISHLDHLCSVALLMASDLPGTADWLFSGITARG